MTRRAFPILNPLFWVDPPHVHPLDAADVALWLAHGMARGFVVAVPTRERALAAHRKLCEGGMTGQVLDNVKGQF